MKIRKKTVFFSIAIPTIIVLFFFVYLKTNKPTDVFAYYEQGIEKNRFLLQPSNTNKIPVISYHQLFKQSDSYNHHNPMNVAVEEFEKQMNFLSENKYQTISLTQLYDFLYNKQPLPKKPVLLTFDDGPKTNYIYAYPILKKHKMHAVSFLITNRIKKTIQPFHSKNETQPLSLQEIQHMKDVFEFGSHSDSMHGREKGIPLLQVKSKEEIQKDAIKSKPYTTFLAYCYPFGQFKERTIEAIQEAGFKMAFSTEEGYAYENSPKFHIPRIAIYPDTSIEEFKRMVEGNWKIQKKK